jgi:methylated-DNA-[protein]-cysteine S-methyltransferase
MTHQTHRWTTFATRFGRFAAAIDAEDRLVRFSFHRDAMAGVRDDAALKPVHEQVEEYCAGKRQTFDLVCHSDQGSNFERGVWQAMTEIPFGETVTYGAIARKLGGAPDAARAVGASCNSNPIALIWPCHRVIGANGALVGFGGGLPLKRALLDFESVIAGRPRDLFASA